MVRYYTKFCITGDVKGRNCIISLLNEKSCNKEKMDAVVHNFTYKALKKCYEIRCEIDYHEFGYLLKQICDLTIEHSLDFEIYSTSLEVKLMY